MRVNVSARMQQRWRAWKIYEGLFAHARQIGCIVVHDEIMCLTEEQSKALAAWWREHA